MKGEELITYCGIYGGACARWCRYTPFRDMAALLAEWVDAQGYQHWMAEATELFDYHEFRKGLSFFSRNDSWLVCQRCCKGGDADPDCALRRCCQEHGLEICFDCADFPCEKISEGSGMIERAREYRALGKEAWLGLQVEKASQGYEVHTKRYYRIRATRIPVGM